MDPMTIRHVLERLACMARGTTSGNGPITSLDLAEAYRLETGEIPGEGVLMQLQRLPGLTPREQDPAARSFVDPDLLAALQGSAIARMALEPRTQLVDRIWQTGLSRDGIRMAAFLLESRGMPTGALLDIARRVERDSGGRPEYRQLIVDLFMVAVELSDPAQPVYGRNLIVMDGGISELNLEERVLEDVTFRHCAIDELYIGPGFNQSSCTFDGCMFSRVAGATSADALPVGVFSHCDFGEFDEASTNAAILRLNISPSLKALMTILRKLYLQAGGGRKIEALKRGMPGGGPVCSLIDPVLRLLVAEEMVAVTGDVAHPVRKHAARARDILTTGALSNDPLVQRVRELSP